jgi:hypothetical protein
MPRVLEDAWKDGLGTKLLFKSCAHTPTGLFSNLRWAIHPKLCIEIEVTTNLNHRIAKLLYTKPSIVQSFPFTSPPPAKTQRGTSDVDHHDRRKKLRPGPDFTPLLPLLAFFSRENLCCSPEVRFLRPIINPPLSLACESLFFTFPSLPAYRPSSKPTLPSPLPSPSALLPSMLLTR